MTMSPMLWAAMLACALGGAAAGNAVGSTSISDRAAAGLYYQTHPTDWHDTEDRPMPDHYPLVTPRGVVPVAQLSDRGLFSQARYRSVTLATDYASNDPEPRLEEGGQIEPAVAHSTSEQPALAPLALAAGPTQVGGSAKIIDVQATLAMR